MALPDLEDTLARTRELVANRDEPPPEAVPATTVIALDVKNARGQSFRGSFCYSVPTLGQQIEIGNLKARYLPSGSPADANAAIIVDVLCYLTVCIGFSDQHPKPAWWDPIKAYDMTPYTALYGRCLEHEDRFHGRRQERGADAGELREQGEREGADPVRVVDEVRPPTKRRETLAGDGA